MKVARQTSSSGVCFVLDFRDDGLEGLGRHQHTWHTGSRVSTGTHHEKVFNILAAIVRTKPGALQQHRFQAKSRAFIRKQIVMEMLRGHDVRRHDVPAQVRQHGIQYIKLMEITMAADGRAWAAVAGTLPVIDSFQRALRQILRRHPFRTVFVALPLAVALTFATLIGLWLAGVQVPGASAGPVTAPR